MQEGLEHQGVAFHDRARNVFFSVYREFRQSIAAVDRQGAENQFQQLQSRYVHQLQQQLNSIALELLGQADRMGYCSQLNHLLKRAIEEYVNEFLQKAKSL